MTYTAENPSPAYAQSLREAKEHQRSKKTWTGGLMERHVDRIKALIDRVGAESALDYGAGKLLQYLRPRDDGQSVDDYLGIPIYKMDPAMVPDYRVPPEMARLLNGRPKPKIPDTLPAGETWDLVIVTHVLRTIPLFDLRDWVVPMLHERANKAIFVTENLDVPHKHPFSRTDDKPEGWTAEQWMELLTIEGGVEVEAWFRGTPGNDPRKTGQKDSTFRKWPFE